MARLHPRPMGRHPAAAAARRLPLQLATALGCLTALAGPARAADEIATDRPDVVESSETVGKGRFQIEASLAWEKDDSAGVKTRTRSTPTLLRYGVADNWELRLETDGWTRSTVSDPALPASERAYGWSDVSLGFKVHTHDGGEAGSWQPSIGWLVHADINSGAREFRGSGVRPSVRMVAEWELPGDYSLGVMPGLFSDKNDDGDRYVGGIFAIVFGKSFTDRCRGFVELAAEQIAAPGDGGNVVTANVGTAYLVTPLVQVDFAIARGLNDRTRDLAWTVGLSVKF